MRTLKLRTLLFAMLLTAACMAQESNVIFNDNKAHKPVTLDHGQLFALNGDNNVLTVNGDCASILVRGQHNKVTFNGAIGSVLVPGRYNELDFAGPVTDVEIGGITNIVTLHHDAAGKAVHLQVTGDGNLVRWTRGGHHDPPDWHDLGNSNKLLAIP